MHAQKIDSKIAISNSLKKKKTEQHLAIHTKCQLFRRAATGNFKKRERRVK